MTTMIQAVPDRPNRTAQLPEESSFPGLTGIPRQAGFNNSTPKRSKQASRWNASSQRLAQERIAASEEIRRHIARELHDDIGQRLSLLSIKLSLLRQLRTVDDPDGGFTESLQDLDLLISDVHNLSHSLHSSRIEHLGLKVALRNLFNRLVETNGTHIDFIARNIPNRLPAGFALCFFRIAQESLSNAIKHGDASHIKVDLVTHDSLLTMRIRDLGRGFDKTLVQEGLGFMTMAERMAAIEGALTIESEPGLGTVITATAELP